MRTWVTRLRRRGGATCQQNKNITQSMTPFYRIPTPRRRVKSPTDSPGTSSMAYRPTDRRSILTIGTRMLPSAVFSPTVRKNCDRCPGVASFISTKCTDGLDSLKGDPDREPVSHRPRWKREGHTDWGQTEPLHCVPSQTDGLSERRTQWVEQYLSLSPPLNKRDWSR